MIYQTFGGDSGGGAYIVAAIGVGGVLLGALGQHLTSSSVAKRAEKKSQRDLLVSRLEELHEAAMKVRRANMKLVYAIRTSWETRQPIQKADLAAPPPHDRIETLIMFYAPNLSAEHERLNVASKAFNALLQKWWLGPPAEEDYEREWQVLRKVGAEIDVAYLDVIAGATNEARRLLGFKPVAPWKPPADESVPK